jgi:hypothetical protein
LFFDRDEHDALSGARLRIVFQVTLKQKMGAKKTPAGTLGSHQTITISNYF